MLSRISKIWVCFFDRQKIKEMNLRLNLWCQTQYGITVTMEIMRWSNLVLQDTGTRLRFHDDKYLRN